jgi:glycosyltransferase involved in cell wall biosynthesis
MTNSPKKIFYITASNRIGGAEASLLRLIEGLKQRGNVEIAGACCLEAQGPLSEQLKALEVPVTSIALGMKELVLGMGRKEIAGALTKSRPDVVQIFGLRAEVAARKIAKDAGAKLISSIRSPDPWRKAHHLFLDRRTEKYVDRFISNSHIGKWSRVVREGFAAEKISVIHNGIDVENFAKCESKANDRVRFGIDESAGPVVAVIANLRSMKGHEAVIEAAATLKIKFPGIRFICAGRDDSNGKYQAMAHEAGVDDVVKFPGFVDDTATLLNVSDYFLLPSSWEGCPTSILEAQAMGLPVIANNAGGMPELVSHCKTGWLLHSENTLPDFSAPMDARAISKDEWQSTLAPRKVEAGEIIKAIKKMEGDESLRKKIADTGSQQVSENFTLEKMVAAHEEIYLTTEDTD